MATTDAEDLRTRPVEDLHGLDEHLDAMILAPTVGRAASVLAHAQQAYLTGIRLTCQRHAGTFRFAELVRHCKLAHDPGDLQPAEEDPRELGRGGQTAADL